LRAHGSRALQYGTTDGVAALREAIAYRASHHGLRVGGQNVLVTTGAQQALDLIGRILIDPAGIIREGIARLGQIFARIAMRGEGS
jgi:2-aminoadipate transaminase